MNGFIMVFRPHQMPAKAGYFYDEADFVDNWLRGCLPSICNCQGWSPPEDEEAVPTYAEAVEDAGHDLNSLTRLDSTEEIRRYLNERNYAGHHNKGLDAVVAICRERFSEFLEEQSC